MTRRDLDCALLWLSIAPVALLCWALFVVVWVCGSVAGLVRR